MEAITTDTLMERMDSMQESDKVRAERVRTGQQYGAGQEGIDLFSMMDDALRCFQKYFLTTLHQIQYKVRCCRRFSVVLFQTAHHQHFIMIFVHLSAKLCDDLVHSFRILRRSPWICDQNRLLFLFFLYKR